MSNQFDPPPAKSGGSNVLMIVLIVCGVLFLLCAGVCGLIGFGAYRAGGEISKVLELIGPSLIAQESIRQNEDVQEKIGEPTFGPPMRSGDSKGELDVSNTRFHFDVTGSKGNGVANCHAIQKDGIWKVLEIKLKLSDGTEIDVPPPMGETPPALNFDLDSENEKK